MSHPLKRTFTATATVSRYNADPIVPAEPGDGPLVLTLIDGEVPGKRYRITVTHRATGLSFRGDYPPTSAGLKSARAVRDGLLAALSPAELEDPFTPYRDSADFRARVWDVLAPHCAEVRRSGRPEVPTPPPPPPPPPTPADRAEALLEAARAPLDPRHLRAGAERWLRSAADPAEIEEVARLLRAAPRLLRLRIVLLCVWYVGEVGEALRPLLARDLVTDHGPFALVGDVDLRDPPILSADGQRAVFRLGTSLTTAYVEDPAPREEWAVCDKLYPADPDHRGREVDHRIYYSSRDAAIRALGPTLGG